jgi:hypothetical protein
MTEKNTFTTNEIVIVFPNSNVVEIGKFFCQFFYSNFSFYLCYEANRNKGLSRCENIKLPSTLTGAFYLNPTQPSVFSCSWSAVITIMLNHLFGTDSLDHIFRPDLFHQQVAQYI